MAGINQIAKLVGIEPTQAYSLFQHILTRTKAGDRVVIKDFGAFFSSTRKAYTVHTPILPGGKGNVPERIVLRFRPAVSTRTKPTKPGKTKK
jgi:nucleoid DNA-binding protein